MIGPLLQLPSKDSDMIFYCFVFFFFFFFYLFLLSHQLIVAVYWFSHVRLFVNLWTVAHQAKKREGKFGERPHGQRPLRTQGWKGLPGGDEGQKASGLHKVCQEPWLPGLAMDTAEHPSVCLLSVLPHICQEPWGLDCGTC